MSDLEKYKESYITEAKEHIAAMNQALVTLEKSPDNAGLLDEIFRQAHTLKSMAATMEYQQSVRICHALEDVLDAVKQKKIIMANCVDGLFEAFDALTAAVKAVINDKQEPDSEDLIKRLQATACGEVGDTDAVETLSDDDELVAVEKVQAIEVKIEKLDQLMNLSEELLINKMQLDGIQKEIKNLALSAAVETFGRLVNELQYNVMQSRLVEMGFVFGRFPRMVRDLAKKQHKEVIMTTLGSDIELDRMVIDEVGESLVHLLRNAVDHGIESIDERKKCGKPESAAITLQAKRNKNSVLIEISDDGAGLDVAAIKAKAIEAGLINYNATNDEILQTIFAGVSTAQQVTEISGRGYGLNVVQEKITSLGGKIRVSSTPGKGTSFTLEVPLTIAVIKALFISVGGQLFAIPVDNIERLLTVDQQKIQGLLQNEALIVGDDEIPVTRLDQLFKMPASRGERQPIVVVRRDNALFGLAVDRFSVTEEIVVKSLSKLVKENHYFTGSTIIGSGEAVLIVDVNNLPLSKRNGVRDGITQL